MAKPTLESYTKMEINKDYYMKQIDIICLMIKNRAEDILQDWDKGIKIITITSDLRPDSLPSISITKEYLPRGEEMKCLLKENLSENN